MEETISLPEQFPKKIKPSLAWAVIVGYTLFLGVAGFIIGQTFFWKVKYNTKNKQALMLASERLAKNPNNIDAIIGMGWAYFQNGQLNQALAEYSKAAKINPEHTGVKINMGLTYLQMGKLDLAEQEFKFVLRFEDKNITAMVNLAVVYVEQKKYDSAIEYLNKAYKYSRGNVEILYQLGRAHELKGDVAQAKYFYEEALTFDPKFEKAKGALEKINASGGQK